MDKIYPYMDTSYQADNEPNRTYTYHIPSIDLGKEYMSLLELCFSFISTSLLYNKRGQVPTEIDQMQKFSREPNMRFNGALTWNRHPKEKKFSQRFKNSPALKNERKFTVGTSVRKIIPIFLRFEDVA